MIDDSMRIGTGRGMYAIFLTKETVLRGYTDRFLTVTIADSLDEATDDARETLQSVLSISREEANEFILDLYSFSEIGREFLSSILKDRINNRIENVIKHYPDKIKTVRVDKQLNKEDYINELMRSIIENKDVKMYNEKKKVFNRVQRLYLEDNIK